MTARGRAGLATVEKILPRGGVSLRQCDALHAHNRLTYSLQGGAVIGAPNYHIIAMAKRNNMDENTETVEEAADETPQDETPQQDAGGTTPDIRGDGGDGDASLAARLDALEEQFAQLKAMFDTLGVGGPAIEPDGDADDDGVDDSIEALFED